MSRYFDKVRDAVAEKFGISEEITVSTSVTEIYGNNKIRIANHRGIIRYTETKITLRASYGYIDISGSGLSIAGLVNDEIYISGNITGIEFCTED